jgi:hypothetical protein
MLNLGRRGFSPPIKINPLKSGIFHKRVKTALANP